MFETHLLPLIEFLVGPPDPTEEAIQKFQNRSGRSFFNLGSDPATVRAEYAKRLRELRGNPKKLDQKQMNACGMAAFLYILMQVDMLAVIQYAIDLFENGRAKIGNFKIAPGPDLIRKNYANLLHQAGEQSVPHMVDWLMMSALRNATQPSEGNETQSAPPRFLGTLHETLSAIVLPHEFADWLTATGYFAVVTNEARAVFQQDFSVAERLAPEEGSCYVAVLMHTRMLTGPESHSDGACRQTGLDLGERLLAIATPNHYVVLDEKIVLQRGDGRVHFSFWCWGLALDGCSPYKIKENIFKDNFYGAVIAKTR